MKKCPTCGKTFEDNLKFCQTDGTALVKDALPPDPYQTVVIRPEDIGAPVPIEPITPSTKAENVEDIVLDVPDDEVEDDLLKTMVSSGVPVDREDDEDLMKTAIVSEAERKEIFGEKPEKSAPPPSPFGESSSVPPEIPKFNEPDLSPPTFGDAGSSSLMPEAETPPPISPPTSPPPPTFEPPKTPSVPPNTPIPSPFDASMPPGYRTPETPPFKEPEAKFNEPSTPFGNSPFDSAPKPANQNIQQSDQSNQQPKDMQNQQYNQPTAGEGQNKTLATVSLVSSILGFICLGLIGSIVGIVTGYMARKNIAENPAEYGGSGFAKIGFILGIVGVIFNILAIIIVVIVLATNPNLLK